MLERRQLDVEAVIGFAHLRAGVDRGFGDAAHRSSTRTGAKLFLIDLSNVGTVARIASFLSVGLLLLVTGYLAPLPPRAVEEPAMSET